MEGLGKDVLEREMKKMRGDYSKGNLVAHKPLPGFKHCFDPLKTKEFSTVVWCKYECFLFNIICTSLG